ncbi:MAG: A24 family peptidase [Archangium sp.]
MTVFTGSLLALVLVIAVITDLRSRTIHDLVTYPALVAMLAIRFKFEGVGDEALGLLSGLAGAAIAGGWFGVFALRKSLGWGDVKLALVMGAAFGFPRVFLAVVFISLAGAFQAVVSLIWQGKLSDTVRGVLARDGETPKKHIPYGVAIALGSLIAMWWDGNAF